MSSTIFRTSFANMQTITIGQSDLPDSNMKGVSTVPADIVVTNQRPDLVIVNRESKVIMLVELTVCFEPVIEAAATRKQNRYASLLSDIEQSDFTPKLVTIEIGSRGLVSTENCNRLKELFSVMSLNKKQVTAFKNNLSKIALLA